MEDVEHSKKILFDAVQPPDRLIKRRGENKLKENLSDICKVLYSTEVRKQPIFVAERLSKLPPVTTHEYGVGKILCELESIKLAVKHINEHNPPQSTTQATQMTPIQPDAIQRIVDAGTQTDVQNYHGQSTQGSPPSPQRDIVSGPSPSPQEDVVSLMEEYITIDQDPCSSTVSIMSDSSLYSDISSGEFSVQDVEHSLGHASNVTDNLPGGSPKGTFVTDSWQTVRTKPFKNSSVINGTGKSTGVRTAAVTKRPNSRDMTNRTVTGVFVSRLDPYTTPKQIYLHIKRMTGYICRPEKLQTKYGGYSSFYILADVLHRRVLLDPQLWPSGTLLKLFYN